MAVVLVASAHGALLQQVAGELEAGGYGVVRAASGHAALTAVRQARPDAILIDAPLPDVQATELCRLLRRDPHVTPHTAILVADGQASRDVRLDVLRAGASDILSPPLDVAELLVKLDAYTHLKTVAEQTQAASLVDAETGLYNLQGLARRIEELGALAVRAHSSLACVVLAPEVADEAAFAEVTAFCAQTIKRGVRHSDAAGRTGAVEFAVVAPRTSETGAIRLAQRLAGALGAGHGSPSFKLRAGYEAVGNLAYAPVSPRDLLARARRAWIDADPESRLGWIRAYEG